ncbi:hypothetical protein TNCV_4178961 [Trichonephila clavipes]|nr:hypothetical protein TNCV_4178961 [Trichonephila clavipes]
MSVAGRLIELLSISIKASASDGTERCDVSGVNEWFGLRTLDFTDPAEPCTALETRKGETLESSVISCMQNNFGKDSYQRTSLAGLAPDSATSIGLRRAPHSAMQDPIQAPPGTTRQAGLYTS